MKNKTEDLRNHLFEAIEMLKNNSDPNASDHEKMDIDTAKAIANLGKVIVDSNKTEVDAMRIIANAQNPELLKEVMKNSNVLKLNQSNPNNHE